MRCSAAAAAPLSPKPCSARVPCRVSRALQTGQSKLPHVGKPSVSRNVCHHVSLGAELLEARGSAPLRGANSVYLPISPKRILGAVGGWLGVMVIIR